MQRQMPVLSQPLSLNPLRDIAKVDEVDYLADFDKLCLKMNEFDKFFKTENVSYTMLRYIPGLVKVGYYRQVHSTETKRKYADDTYKNNKVVKFNVQLTKGHYTNFQNVKLCFPLIIKSATNTKNDVAAGIITVNNFLVH